jgi:starch phosphorylase
MENIFIFGLTAGEVLAARSAGLHPEKYVRNSPALKETLDAIAKGAISPDDPKRYQPLIDNLMKHDYFLVTADFDAYAAAQAAVDAAYGSHDGWFRKAVLNTAHSGWFSADRTIRGYARDIWRLPGFDGTGSPP